MTITERKDHWLDVLFRDRVEFIGDEGILLPRGSTGQRPVLPKVENGYLRYNTDTQDFEGYKNGAWTPISTGASTVGEINDGVNVGAGQPVFRDKTGVDLNFRSISAGSSLITVVIGGGGDEIIIDTPAGSLFLPIAGGQMTGDIEMLVGAQFLADRNATSANAAIAFYTDADTGFYQGALGSGNIGVTNDGVPSWVFTNTGDFVPFVDVTDDIGSLTNYVRDTHSERFVGKDGSNTNPTFTFGSDLTTGMYREAGGSIGFTQAGTQRWRISTAGHYEPAALGLDVGAAGTPVRNFWGRYYLGDPAFSGLTNPTFSFIGDTQTGMYRPAVAELGWAIGGSAAFSVEADGTLVVPPTTAASNNYEDQVTADDDIPNKKYVDDAIVAGAAQTFRLSFNSGDLVAGILTVNHALSQDWVEVAVWDNTRNRVYPNINSTDANNVTIDFTSWTVAGTWNVVVIG